MGQIYSVDRYAQSTVQMRSISNPTKWFLKQRKTEPNEMLIAL